ncbi:hypothetical protein, partial [Patulibacter sp.]|uniref:hypothetical protein n=1 Tax=Patulibacter sp. TaxID=1912859 RepID=UPI002720C29C
MADVQVRITGVRDGAHLDGLITTMRGIRGVTGVTLRAYESVHEPLLLLRTARPAAVGSELRAGLGRQVTACVVADGRIDIELDGGGPHVGPRPGPRAGAARPAGRAPGANRVPPQILDAWLGPASPAARVVHGPHATPTELPGRRTRGAPGAWAR